MRKIILLLLPTLFLLISCDRTRYFMATYPQDNPIEEWVEDIIEKKTGYDFDLSPFSSEEEEDHETNDRPVSVAF